MTAISHDTMLLDTLVYGRASEWEKHETGTYCRFVKPIATSDPLVKAQIAQRYDDLGFVPLFFKEHGQEFVALESVKQRSAYQTIEQAFVEQILSAKS
jgi:hypothetical protein